MLLIDSTQPIAPTVCFRRAACVTFQSEYWPEPSITRLDDAWGFAPPHTPAFRSINPSWHPHGNRSAPRLARRCALCWSERFPRSSRTHLAVAGISRPERFMDRAFFRWCDAGLFGPPRSLLATSSGSASILTDYRLGHHRKRRSAHARKAFPESPSAHAREWQEPPR